jgi:hypothetical protein
VGLDDRDALGVVPRALTFIGSTAAGGDDADGLQTKA